MPPSAPRPTGPRAYIDHPVGVAALQVVEHGGLVEVCQHGHVLDHVELGGVHGLHLVLLHHPCLAEEGTRQGEPSPHPAPQILPGGRTVPWWGQPWPQCLLSSRQGCPRFWGDSPRAAPAAPATKPSWHKQAQLVPSSGRGALAEPGKLFPLNVLNTPVLYSPSQPKSPCQGCLLLQHIPGYLGKQLKPVPHHLKLDLFNPMRPSRGKYHVTYLAWTGEAGFSKWSC